MRVKIVTTRKGTTVQSPKYSHGPLGAAPAGSLVLIRQPGGSVAAIRLAYEDQGQVAVAEFRASDLDASTFEAFYSVYPSDTDALSLGSDYVVEPVESATTAVFLTNELDFRDRPSSLVVSEKELGICLRMPTAPSCRFMKFSNWTVQSFVRSGAAFCNWRLGLRRADGTIDWVLTIGREPIHFSAR